MRDSVRSTMSTGACLYQKKAGETQDLGEAKPANKCQYPGAGASMVDSVDRRSLSPLSPASKIQRFFNACKRRRIFVQNLDSGARW